MKPKKQKRVIETSDPLHTHRISKTRHLSLATLLNDRYGKPKENPIEKP